MKRTVQFEQTRAWSRILIASFSLCVPSLRAETGTPPAPAEAAEVADSAPAEASESPGKRREMLVDNSNPYRAIVARNAFRLKDPVPPPPPPTNGPAAPEPVKTDVKLAGIAEIKGVRYAYLMIPDTDRPGQFLYPSLTDDPQRGRVRHGSGLEVREINVKKKTVRVVNGGVEATLNFQDNGVKNVPGTAPAGKPGGPPVPGAPGAPGVNIPKPGSPNTTVFPAGGGALPNPGDTKQPASSEPIVFSRNANRASANLGNSGNASGNAFVPVVGTPLSGSGTVTTPGSATANLPLRAVRTDTTPAQIPSIPVEHQYDVLIRQRQAAESVGIRLPPIPGMPADPNPVPAP